MTKQKVSCTQCGQTLMRQTWNYAHNRPMTAFFCDNVCKGVWQKAQREAQGYTREWLVNQYHEQGKSANQIAREIGKDSKRVWEWIKDYGLETRPRGTDYGQNFKAGMVGTMTGKKHSEVTREKIRQAALADGRRPWGKNNEPYWKGVKGEAHPSWQGGITPERQGFYASQEWKEAVKAVWARDKGICQKCGKNHNQELERGKFDIHHITPFRFKALRADPTNLILLCKPCHKWVHSKKNIFKEYINNESLPPRSSP